MTTVNISEDRYTVIVNDGDEDTIVVTAPSPSVVVEIGNAGPQGPQGPQGAQGAQGPSGGLVPYASIIDTTDQPLLTTSASQPVNFNTILSSRGISIVSANRITFSVAGIYRIFISLQVTNSHNATDEVNVFFKKNGESVPNSNTRVDISPRKSTSIPFHLCLSIEYQLSVVNNDYIQVCWSAVNTNIKIDTIPANGLHPQAPSAILNIGQVTLSD